VPPAGRVGINGLVVAGAAAVVDADDLPATVIESMTSSPSFNPDFISAFDPSIAPVTIRVR
jgi:hypothetical protein